MKSIRLSIYVALLASIFIACNKDDEVSNPETPEHSGEIVRVDLSYDQFVGSNSLKSTDDTTVYHNYISTGYTVIIKDAYDILDGTFKDMPYYDVDLLNQDISFDAIGWFGIEVSHPDNIDGASGYEAYYSVKDDHIDATTDGNITIPLDLTQVSVHLANGTGYTWGSQINTATINGVTVSAYNTPVYVPANTDYTVDVTFQHGDSDSVTNKGTAGQAFYHVINDQSIGTGIIFDLPSFGTPEEGGGIGD